MNGSNSPDFVSMAKQNTPTYGIQTGNTCEPIISSLPPPHSALSPEASSYDKLFLSFSLQNDPVLKPLLRPTKYTNNNNFQPNPY